MKIKTLLQCYLLVFLLTSCGDKPPVLPEITQQGLSTFGCLVNGELVIQEKKQISFWGDNRNLPYGCQDTTGQFKLIAPVEYGHGFIFYITKPNVGKHIIDSVIFIQSNTEYYYMARNEGSLTFIRFDSIIVAGTFEFNADCYEKNTGHLVHNKKIRVHKGRFDVKNFVR